MPHTPPRAALVTAAAAALAALAATGGGGGGAAREALGQSRRADGAELAVSGAGLQPRPAGADLVLRAHGMEILFAKRLAGAIYSLKFRGQEYVQPLVGNGGSMQSAMAVDIRRGESAQVTNPTEAGALGDRDGSTTSRWLEARASETEAYTRTQMAYFARPGILMSRRTNHNVAAGKVDSMTRSMDGSASPLSPVVFSKRVAASPNLLRYRVTFDVPRAGHAFFAFSMLTVYMPPEFSDVYALEGAALVKKPAEFRVPPGKPQPRALALAVPGGAHAMAFAALDWPRRGEAWEEHPEPWYWATQSHDGVTYAAPGSRPRVVRTRLAKMNVVWHARAPAGATLPPGPYTFETAVALGTLDEVRDALRRVLV